MRSGDAGLHAGGRARYASLGGTTGHLALLTPLLIAYASVALVASQTPADETRYLRFAENLTNGYYSPRGADVDLWFGPGLPILLAPVVALDAPVEITRLVGPVLLFAAVVGFYVLLRLTTSRLTALVGALALGLYIPTLPLLPTLHSELPAMLYVVCFMVAFTLDMRHPRPLTLSAAAASLALLSVTRVVFGWVLVATLILALATHVIRRSVAARRLAVVSAVGLCLTSPWLVYTYDVSGKLFYWSTSGGLSLYWMSSPYPGDHGDWHSPEEAVSDERLAPHREFFVSLRGLDQIERDERLRTEAVRRIREHPLEYVENVAANISRLWFSTPISHTPQKLSTTFYIVPNAFLLTGLLAAAVVLMRSPRRRPEALAFGLVLIPGVGVQALLAGYTRMLVPLVPVMLWFVVQACVEVARQPTR